MQLAVDMHIHTALSPCADNDMTPNNIVNMAIIKKLDAIAITDHNSCDNVEAVMKTARDKLIVIPGMEVQSREEVHLLCYFYDLKNLKDFDIQIKKSLIYKQNIPELFGEQLILDENDEIIGQRQELLISSVDLSVDDIVGQVRKHGGVVVPAHVDRYSYSLLSQLGFIPPHLNLTTLEFSRSDTNISSRLQDFRHIHSSDAHYLWDILERTTLIDVKCKTVCSILNYLTNTDLMNDKMC